jgi:hypothetical protein
MQHLSGLPTVYRSLLPDDQGVQRFHQPLIYRFFGHDTSQAYKPSDALLMDII